MQQLVLFKENSNRNYHISLHQLELDPKQLSKFACLITVVSTQRHDIQGSLPSSQRETWMDGIQKIELEIEIVKQKTFKYHPEATH